MSQDVSEATSVWRLRMGQLGEAGNDGIGMSICPDEHLHLELVNDGQDSGLKRVGLLKPRDDLVPVPVGAVLQRVVVILVQGAPNV